MSVIGNKTAPVSRLRAFWQHLDGEVHPDDSALLAAKRHTYNLEFPPPAFIGNVETARVIILRNNGGFNPVITAREFPTIQDRREHIDYLHGTRADFPKRLSSWYTTQPWFGSCQNGQIALINAVAYRSPKFTKEVDNIRLARDLPSRKLHLTWLVNEILPQAKAGHKMIVAHNWSAWGFSRSEKAAMNDTHNVIFCTNPVSPHLSTDVVNRINAFLKAGSF